MLNRNSKAVRETGASWTAAVSAAVIAASVCCASGVRAADSFDYGEANVLNEQGEDRGQVTHLADFSGGTTDAYFAWKDAFSRSTGINYIIEDGIIFQTSPDGDRPSHTDNELNIIGNWAPPRAGGSSPVSVIWWLQNALTIGGTTTSGFQERLGILSPPNGGDTAPESSIWRLQHLAFEIKPPGNRFRFQIGKLTTRVLMNENRYASSDREDFFTPVIVNNPVAAYTARAGLGAFAQYRTDAWYISAFIRAPDAEKWIRTDALEQGDAEYAGEFALTPTIPGLGVGNYRFTVHYSDDVDVLMQPESWNFALSFDQDFGPSYGAFFRYTYSDNSFRAFEQRLTLGLQKKGVFHWPDDRLGVAFWWADTTDEALNDEYGIDTFWRMQTTKTLEISPGMQFIFDPAKSDDDFVTIFGLRARKLL